MFSKTRQVMGVLNVTPDSFSDGGRYLDHSAAIAHGLQLVEHGADIIDVGGESTRPGAESIDAEVELARVVPVIRALVGHPTVERSSVVISVDTTKAAVAAAAIDAGARIVNDVSAGRPDPDMLGVVASGGAGYVVMHRQGTSRSMQRAPRYHDVVGEVCSMLIDRLDVARAAGIAADAVIADPGIGFGKTLEHNLQLLGSLRQIVDTVCVPVLVGTSRKSFMGAALGLAVDQRDEATLATTVWAYEHGATMVRVHDVRAAVHAAGLLSEMRRAS